MNTYAEQVEVAGWCEHRALAYRNDAWSSWLHGSVAAIHESGHVVLVVPMTAVTPAAVALATRLYHLGSYTVLPEAA